MADAGNRHPRLDYIARLYAPEDEILRDMRLHAESIDRAIHIGAEEGKLLQLLITLHQPKRILEIGTLTGYSALWMARALADDGHLITLDRNEDLTAVARAFMARTEVADKVTFVSGFAADILPSMIDDDKSFDMVFIDADKINYPLYLDYAEKLLRVGGLLVADNTLLFDTVYLDSCPERKHLAPTTWQAMRDFNEQLSDNSRFSPSIMIPTTEGLSVAIKR